MNKKLLKTSGADVLSSRKKLRKTLWGGKQPPPPPPPCTSEGEVIVKVKNFSIYYLFHKGSIRALTVLSLQKQPSLQILDKRRIFLHLEHFFLYLQLLSYFESLQTDEKGFSNYLLLQRFISATVRLQ